MQYPSGGLERNRPPREMTSVLASTAVHALALIVLSFFFLKPEPEIARIDAAGRFVDEQLPGVTTIVEAEPVIVGTEAALNGSDASASFDLSPTIAETADLLPKGLADAVEPALGVDASLPPGVASAIADIQDRVQQAGGKTGEIQFSLSWYDRNDLDLHVVVPKGKRISWESKGSTCGGKLDVDMNVHAESREPVENVRWLKGRGLSGRYTVIVNFFQRHEPHQGIPFEVVSKVGKKTELTKATVGLGKNAKAFRFIYIRPSVSAKRRVILIRKYERLQIEEEAIASRLLKEALADGGRDLQKISVVAFKYPHTDAAIKAWRLLPGVVRK